MTSASTVKNKKTSKRNNKMRFVLFVVMFGYFVWVFITQQIEFTGKQKVLAQVEANIEEQKQISEQLAERYEVVNSPEYIERIAREELGFARPDEIIFYDATLKK